MKKKENMKTNVILLIGLAVLLVLAGVEAIELNNLENKLSSGAATYSSSSSTPSTSGGVAVPNSLTNLPDMVGGC